MTKAKHKHKQPNNCQKSSLTCYLHWETLFAYANMRPNDWSTMKQWLFGIVATVAKSTELPVWLLLLVLHILHSLKIKIGQTNFKVTKTGGGERGRYQKQ